MQPLLASPNARKIRPLIRAAAVLLILMVGAVAGCSDDDTNPTSPGGPTTTTGFTGVFANGTTSGKLAITIKGETLAGPSPGHRTARAPAHQVTANAVLTPSTGPGAALYGIYDVDADSLYLAGSGYVLIGHYDDSVDPPVISGTLSGPGGDAVFRCLLGPSIKVYCGTYESTAGPATGTWNLVTIDTVLVGIAFPEGGNGNSALVFAGTVARTGATRAIAFSASQPGVFDLTGTGSLDTATNNVSGSWTFDDLIATADDSGTWSGTICP